MKLVCIILIPSPRSQQVYVQTLILHLKEKQERQIMHLALIKNTFQHEEDKVESELLECMYDKT